MGSFTNIYCEACGQLGDILSADGWNTCMVHYVLAKPSRKRFDRVTGEAIPLPAGAPPDEPLQQLPNGARAAVYLTSADVSAVAGQGHWGLAASGGSRRWMAEYFPGWHWKNITDAIRRVDAFRKPGMHGGYLDRAYAGVLLSSTAVATLDDGSLEHPLKTARLVAGEKRPPARPSTPVAADDGRNSRSSATNPGSYASRFCEVCGVRSGGVHRGWTVCNAHVGIELPDAPLFDGRTGARLRGEP